MTLHYASVYLQSRFIDEMKLELNDETEALSITRFPVTVKKILEAEARKQDRSLASLCRMLLIDFAYSLQTKQPAPPADAKREKAKA